MPSEMVDHLQSALPLVQAAPIERPVSGSEYYHASIGSCPLTLERDRQIVFALEAPADASMTPQRWRAAIDAVTAVNPALRMRWVGVLGWSRWRSDGPPPALRVMDHMPWDFKSNAGMEFLDEWPLNLRTGPVVEFIIGKRADQRQVFIMRTHHAIMDGMGGFHVFDELFRFLRGEALVGSNARFSDSDMIKALNPPKPRPLREPTCRVLEASEVDPPPKDPGDDWVRMVFNTHSKQILARMACAFAQLAHRRSSLPAVIAVPVDLRRHYPGLVAVTNFSSMLIVKLWPGEGPEVFQSRLKALLNERMELAVASGFDAIRWFPQWLVDLLLGRTWRNFMKRRPMETVVISNLGVVPLDRFQAPGFQCDDFGLAPLPGNGFATLHQVNGQLRIVLNLPRIQTHVMSFDEVQEALQALL